MSSLSHVAKQSGFRLIPFAVCIALYAGFVQFTEKGQWWTAVAKCAPIVSLMMFILLFGFRYMKSNTYPRIILVGLIFSCIGDALLDMGFFEFGVGAFFLAQLCYICAFGWQPYMWWIGVVLYISASALTGILLKHLDSISQYGVPIYALALTTMSWRALARIWKTDDSSLLLVRIICGIGSVLFVISDAIIAIDRFYITIPHSGYYVMITYYAAQLGIALSVLPAMGQDTKHLITDVNTETAIEPEGRYAAKGSRLTD